MVVLVLLQILVLGWCVSQRDMEVVRKVVQQVCMAHAPEGGTTVSGQHGQQAPSRMPCHAVPAHLPCKHGTASALGRAELASFVELLCSKITVSQQLLRA
jgi:hypothetical protein